MTGGDIYGEPFDGDAPLPGAQVAEPDEAECEYRRRIAIRRASDGGPSVLAVAQKGARKGGRQAVLQVRLGAQFRQLPFRKLAPQKQAEAFAKYHAPAAAPHVGARAAGQVEQEELPFAPREPLHYQFQTRVTALFDRRDAPRQVARAIPGLQREARPAHLEREIVSGERQQFFAGLEQRWFSRIAEEGLDGRADLIGAAAGVPRNGRHCESGL